MIRRLFISGLIVSSISAFSQNINKDLVQYLKDADSVLLTHHEDLRLDIETPGKSVVIHRTLLKNDIPNDKIIKKKILLTPEMRQELIEIIKNQKKEKLWEGAFCFEPHHTIFFYKTKKWSYIDLCFGCKQYNYVPNVPVNRDDFLRTYQEWKNLEDFFTKLGLN
ncbi:hypothetical protein F3J23_06490 [Chryseobacterium sp. Tr-659]|uniref:hypothetical protein n=1 Tax=Chryseobacterium sp. Tr-659 TaxID=2608340 RepID=UPI00141F7A7A|nr:hypothetical protein [Chryseobacterium sp. Tr-659]NIF05087.1 hypothetical protein [Chryseobacterium sp. Tr-659]